MNTLDTILNWNPLLTEGQVKKRVANKVMNRTIKALEDVDVFSLPKRYSSIGNKLKGTKKGRQRMIDAGGTKRIQRQAVERGDFSEEDLKRHNKHFIDTGKNFA